MAQSGKDPDRIELIQGTLDMLILQILRWGPPQHGYGISQAIRAGSADVLQVETGSLYPALHRLEKQRWIKSEWDVSENNQRAKYYRITAAGRKQLSTARSRWNQVSAAIAGLMKRMKARGRRELVAVAARTPARSRSRRGNRSPPRAGNAGPDRARSVPGRRQTGGTASPTRTSFRETGTGETRSRRIFGRSWSSRRSCCRSRS
jgi:transcriptional regulator